MAFNTATKSINSTVWGSPYNGGGNILIVLQTIGTVVEMYVKSSQGAPLETDEGIILRDGFNSSIALQGLTTNDSVYFRKFGESSEDAKVGIIAQTE